MDATYNQAYPLMTSAKAREAFELTQQPEDRRTRYGKTRIGQGCLLARRLVERACASSPSTCLRPSSTTSFGTFSVPFR